MSKVYVTRKIPQEATDLLQQYCELEMNSEDRVLARDELLEKVQGKDAVLCLLTDTIDNKIFAIAGKQCKIFANYAVGYNNIDINAATKHGIIVTNTPGVLDNSTADMAWALLFAVSRRIIEADNFTRAGKFKGWGPMMYLGREISGKTLGVIGTGRIGSNFARKALGFDMKILYTDLKPNPVFEKQTNALFVDKSTLLKEADFVSIHIPLLPETRNYISENELKIMKNTAVLINTARGPIVNEKALIKALKDGEIWGAGLDVYHNEPDLEPGLAELPNVVIAPHIASATIETRTNMGMIAARNIINVITGKVPETCVNPEVIKYHNLR
ncbi:MAG: D-glycerate dehydrogenase [Spirochaetes bacterium]|nr:D-glycerate dehydrogenase [Spirochaetota bacterium]